MKAAINEWTIILGDSFIKLNNNELNSAENTTFKTTQKVKAILQPQNSNDVSACVKVANKYRIPLYPISCGKNWGYGSKVPVKTDSVILDLSRMNKIIEFDSDHAYVVVEPGVTQSQLLNFLEKETNGNLWLDTVASSPHTSLIGNAMERGHGTTPYCDRISQCNDLEIVLANGEIINTGYGIFKNCKTRNLDSWGLGPAISHLFSQSNFGIVTKMALMLYPSPEYMKIGVFNTNSEHDLEHFINRTRTLRLKGILKAGPHISNHYTTLLRLLNKYPINFNEEVADKLCAELNIFKWSAIFGIWGTKSEVSALETEINKTLYDIGILKTFDHGELIADPHLPPTKKQDLLNFFQQMSGKITGMGLTRPYWKTKKSPSDNIFDIDLDKDNCGFLSINPCTPFKGKDALVVAKLATKIILKYGFEPNITAYSTRPRILQFHITICFNRENQDEDQRALTCQTELLTTLQQKGYYLFRLNIASMQQFHAADTAYLNLIKILKTAIDPNHILAPGRYN